VSCLPRDGRLARVADTFAGHPRRAAAGRQAGLLRGGRGDEVVQETRLFDEGRGVTYSMRRKEGLADYRYFPEPDLLPLHVSGAYLEEMRVRAGGRAQGRVGRVK